jgi:hypothetical protein
MEFLEIFLKTGILNTKHRSHSYIKDYYDILFSNNTNKKIKILELGVRDRSSLHIWENWFVDSEIYGIDIHGFYSRHIGINNNIIIVTIVDGYSQPALDLYEDNFFDYIIDDGPHTIDSQQYSIAYWYKKLKIGGKLIIEDIGCRDGVPNPPESSDYALEQLIKVIPENITYKVFDLRDKDPGQYDSIILEINK